MYINPIPANSKSKNDHLQKQFLFLYDLIRQGTNQIRPHGIQEHNIALHQEVSECADVDYIGGHNLIFKIQFFRHYT